MNKHTYYSYEQIDREPIICEKCDDDYTPGITNCRCPKPKLELINGLKPLDAILPNLEREMNLWMIKQIDKFLTDNPD